MKSMTSSCSVNWRQSGSLTWKCSGLISGPVGALFGCLPCRCFPWIPPFWRGSRGSAACALLHLGRAAVWLGCTVLRLPELSGWFRACPLAGRNLDADSRGRRLRAGREGPRLLGRFGSGAGSSQTPSVDGFLAGDAAAQEKPLAVSATAVVIGATCLALGGHAGIVAYLRLLLGNQVQAPPGPHTMMNVPAIQSNFDLGSPWISVPVILIMCCIVFVGLRNAPLWKWFTVASGYSRDLD